MVSPCKREVAMPDRRRFLAQSIALAGLALSSCGGGGYETPPNPSPSPASP